MTKQDTYQVLATLQAFYPDSFRGMTDEAAQLKVALWQEQFADEPATLVQAAVKAYISTDKKGFMPVPGQIKAQLAILQEKNELSEQDAWELVTKALRNSSYGSAEEFSKLPSNVQRAVGSANMLKNWASVSVTELHTVIASNFKRDYRSVMSQAQNLDQIPSAVKKIADETKPKMLQGGRQSAVNTDAEKDAAV